MRFSVYVDMRCRTAALILAAFLLLPAQPAWATNKVSSPDITKGWTELEYRGGYDWDESSKRNGIDQHKFVANYGFTDYYRSEVKLDMASDGSERDWTYIEWSNRFQLIKSGSVWPRLSLQENYKFALQSGVSDRLEGTILAAQDAGDFSHVTNISLEGDVGGNADAGGTDLNIGWKTKYRYRPVFEPGVEIYANYGRLIGPGKIGTKKYAAGPVFYGALAHGIKYDIGILLGLNNATPDARLKAILTYGF